MAQPRIMTCLWFDDQAEEAARLYTGIFPNSRIGAVRRYTEAGKELHGHEAGSVMSVDFELDGEPFQALNGGPLFRFTEAISMVVRCDTQEEVDYYWEKLGEGGDPNAQQCGWLKDRFGLSWQVVPAGLDDLFDGTPGAERVMTAMLAMKKLDMAALKRAHAGE